LPLSKHLPRDVEYEIEIKKLARSTIPQTGAGTKLTIDQANEPLGRLILGGIFGRHVAGKSAKSPRAAEEANQVEFVANLVVPKWFSQHEHQAAAAIQQPIMPASKPLTVCEKMLKARQRDFAIGKNVDQFAYNLMTLVDPKSRVSDPNVEPAIVNRLHSGGS
jgi:hypothetical protein